MSRSSAAHLGEQVPGECLAFDRHGVSRSDAGAGSAAPWLVVIRLGKWPSARWHSVVWSRQTARVRRGDQVVVALGQQPQHREMILGLDLAQRLVRSATTAAERASWRSVLSLRPESSSRTRADNVGGTSTTRSPAATSCWANNAPVPVAPSIAHNRGSNGSRPVQQPVALPAIGTHPKLVEDLLGAIEHRRGVGPPVRVDPDDEHVVLLSN